MFSQVLRLLAAEGMAPLGTLSLGGTKLAGKVAHNASRTLPQIEKYLPKQLRPTPPKTLSTAAARSR